MILTASAILEKEEGYSDIPYYCSEGFPTIGFGFLCGKKGEPLPKITTTREDAKKKLTELITKNYEILKDKPYFKNLNHARKATLLSIAHQIGIAGLSKFKGMNAALSDENYSLAGDCCLDSLAATQTPNRWKRNAYMLRSGLVDEYYKNA